MAKIVSKLFVLGTNATCLRKLVRFEIDVVIAKALGDLRQEPFARNGQFWKRFFEHENQAREIMIVGLLLSFRVARVGFVVVIEGVDGVVAEIAPKRVEGVTI